MKGLSVVDCHRQKKVDFTGDIGMDTLVSEVVAEAIHKLDLPRNIPHNAVHDGRELNQSDSLADAGLKDNDEIMISPEVSAGFPA